jgi:CDP-glucose 4,6-dehydratase
MVNPEFWNNKKVFITGHTGFKGSWLSLWLSSMGAEVKGYALPPEATPNLFEVAKITELINSELGDIRNLHQLRSGMIGFNPDILIHMAAQPLVRLSYKEPIETYETNVMGTAKVLESARSCENLKSIISVTTDKCYENREWVWGYREDEPMGGFDPYSSSKGCAELLTSAYRRSFMQDQRIGLASVRAGNVIGGGDWAEDRLIPDILRSFEMNKPVVIRNPKSIRPWQHVLEPLSGYLVLAEKLYESPDDYAEGWNFGPHDGDAKPVEWILDKMVTLWGEGAFWQLDEGSHPHEAGFLKLDISKAKSRLNWKPTWHLQFTLERIVKWHQSWMNNKDMQAVCLNEIDKYMRDMSNENN